MDVLNFSKQKGNFYISYFEKGGKNYSSKHLRRDELKGKLVQTGMNRSAAL